MAEFRLDLIGDTENLTASLNEVNKSLEDLSDEAVKTSKATQAAFNDTGGVQKMDKSLKSQVLTLAKLESEMTKIIKAKKTAFDGKEAAALDIQLKNVGESLLEVDKQLASVDDSSRTLTAQFRANKDILAEMEAQGLDTSETYRQLEQTTAELGNQIDDTNKRIKFLGSDTKGMQGLIAITQTVTAGFAVAQGTAALFGNENENVQKALLKVNAAMAVLSGLQEIQQALQRSSAFTITIENVARKAKIFLLGQETAGTVAVTTAQRAAIITSRALRIALIATGIGAFVVLLGFAAEKMGAFGDSTAETTEKIKAQKQAVEDHYKELLKVADLEEEKRNRNKDGLNDLNRELELLKARGATIEEIFTKEQQIRNKELDNLGARLGTILGNAKLEVEIEEEIKNKRNEIQAAETAFLRNESEERIKISEDEIKRRRAIVDGNNANRIAAMEDGLEKELAALTENQRKEKLQAQEHGLSMTLLNAKFAKERTEIVLKYEKIKLEEQKRIDEFLEANMVNQFDVEKAENEKILQNNLDFIDGMETIKLLELEIEAAIGDKSIKQLKEIEKRKNQIQLEAAQERLDLLKATGGSEVEIKRLELAIINFQKNIEKESGGIFEALNLTPEQATAIKESYQIIADSIKSILLDGVNDQIRINDRAISSIEQNILAVENNIERQKQLQQEGKANELQAERDKLTKLEGERRIALERDKKLQKDKLNIDAITQISALITASAQIFAAYSPIPYIGIPLAIAVIGSMFAAFASAQIKARENINSQQFGEGGWIDGKTHSEGGVKYHSEDSNIELEGGEHVTKKRQAAKYAHLLEAINSDRLKQMDLDELLKHTGVSLNTGAIEGYKERVALNKRNDKIESIKLYSEFNPELKGLREDFNKFVEKMESKETQVVAGDYLIKKQGSRTIRKKI